MKYCLNLLATTTFFLFTIFSFNAQVLDSVALDTVKVFKSLESALRSPKEVYILDLSRDKLKEFPEEIYQFENLNVLNLSKNKIKSIPDSLRKLQYLQDLNLSKNKIEDFNTSICSLSNLKKLVMNQNLIQIIPSCIGELKELVVLDMWSNDLYGFPQELSDLEKLQVFDIRAILINDEIKNMLKDYLPNTEILTSATCDCDL